MAEIAPPGTYPIGGLAMPVRALTRSDAPSEEDLKRTLLDEMQDAPQKTGEPDIIVDDGKWWRCSYICDLEQMVGARTDYSITDHP